MKITESQLKTIILEEAAKVKKAFSLKKQLQEVQQQLDEVMGGPHGQGKKSFKKAAGGFKETQGALVEDEEVVNEEIGFSEEGETCPACGGPANHSAGAPEEGHGLGAVNPNQAQEETFDFSEEELEEMLNMSETSEEVIPGGTTEDGVSHEMRTGADVSPQHNEEEPIVAEADKTSDPFTIDAPKQFNIKESAELLRMKALAGLLK